ncbi:GGDEF domain-containing protein [Shewanella sp. GXUN23E]|uniref:GGDEF domain-containing protein n=1 Tax=Shewanella sp. GXUN23E TaxID=3422498 RepID=UPI003D7ED771
MHRLLPKQRATKFLSEQMQLQDLKRQFGVMPSDSRHLQSVHDLVMDNISRLTCVFYEEQLNDAKAALLIGDAQTLSRLQSSLTEYIETLFLGEYDMEYVNYRLRIGVVHKRIGVDVRMFLSGLSLLKGEMIKLFIENPHLTSEQTQMIGFALDRLLTFDTSLIIETYHNALMAEVENERNRSQQYAEKVEALNAELTRLTNTDTLTQLNNRYCLNNQSPKLFARCKRRNIPLAAVYIDIDNFKEINDIEGHDRGDEVLRQLSDIIRTMAQEGDQCYRIGGDEFLILRPGTDLDALTSSFSTKFQELIARTEGLEISFGMVCQEASVLTTVAELISQADQLMYKAKSAKKAHAIRN